MKMALKMQFKSILNQEQIITQLKQKMLNLGNQVLLQSQQQVQLDQI